MKERFDPFMELDQQQIVYLFERKNGTEVICPLCEGSHGNNSNCQRND
jgi:hypothetical protein